MLWTRLKWVTLAAFAPEIILWTAFSQWWAARRLKIEVNKLGQTCHSSQQQTQATQHGINGVKHGLKAYQTWPGAGRHEPKETTRVTEFTPWTMKEAFFALSGGFAVKSSSFFPFDSVTFTAKGVLQLARAGMLPHMSRRDIEDKSKADWLAKGLACFQGVTFFGIMIGRWAQRLPVTLLEVHVLIHVICAFAMYLIWFEKGYDIQRPLYCDDERIVDLAAFFSLEPIFAQSHLGITEAIIYNGEECCTCDPRYNVTLGPVQCAHLYPMDNYATRRNFLCETFETLERADGIDHSRVREQVTRVNRAIALLRQNNAHICWLAHDSYSHLNVRNQGLECLVFPDGPFVATRSSNTIVEGALTRNDYAPSESEQAHSDSKTTCPHKVSSTSDAASASQVSITASKPGATQPAGANEGQPVHSTQTPDSGRSSESSSLPTVSVLGPEPETETIRSPRSSSESRTARSINLARVVGEPDTLKKFLRLDWVGLWLSCAAYGSAHLSAWNLYFPTAKEMWVWRGTALSLIAAPALAIPAVGLKMLSSRMEKHKEIHANTTNRAWRVVHSEGRYSNRSEVVR